MSDHNNGGPAFPQSKKGYTSGINGSSDHVVFDVTGGMSLRDYFAAQVLPQIYAASAPDFARSNMKGDEYASITSACAYMIADAMLAERTKESK